MCSPQSSHLTPVSCPRRPRAPRRAAQREPTTVAARGPFAIKRPTRAPSAQFGGGWGPPAWLWGGRRSRSSDARADSHRTCCGGIRAFGARTRLCRRRPRRCRPPLPRCRRSPRHRRRRRCYLSKLLSASCWCCWALGSIRTTAVRHPRVVTRLPRAVTACRTRSPRPPHAVAGRGHRPVHPWAAPGSRVVRARFTRAGAAATA